MHPWQGVHLHYEQYGDVPQVWVSFITKNSLIEVCFLRDKFSEWGVTFREIFLDDLSINQMISCSILNQIVQHFSITIILTY